MKPIRRQGLCLVVAIATSAAIAATASASAPEYGRCVKKAVPGGSGFSNAGCTKVVEEGAKFEWLAGPGAKNKFTSKGGVTTIETVNGTKITCQGETDAGEYAGPKVIQNLTVTFTECESGGLKCTSAGQSQGTIVSKPLEGLLAFAIFNKKGKREGTGSGGHYSPVVPGGALLEFSCPGSASAGVLVVVQGAVLVFVKVNRMELTTTHKFSAVKGKQKPEFYEEEGENERGILESSFGGGPFEQTGLTTTDTITNEEKIEINAVV